MAQMAQNLPDHLKGQFVAHIEEMQVKDTLKMYNRLVSSCFGQCVTTFHGKRLDKEETKCVNTCVEKFMHMQKRVGQRFAEHNMTISQQNLGGMGGQPGM